jgi:hypothetical protein
MSSNEVAYVTAMGSWERWGRSDALDGASRLFSDMKKQYREGNFECRPTVRTFGQIMVILCSKRAPFETKHWIQTTAFHERVWRRGGPCGIELVSWVCALTSGNEQDRQDSLQSAFEVFESLRNNKMGTDSNSYISMLHACANLLDEI